MAGSGSTNTIDQLLGHTSGPADPVTDRDLTRARSSAYIVHGNFNELARMCDNISTTGLIVVATGTETTDVENEIYRRVHNYVSSLYSYNEQIRQILNKHLNQHIGKNYFLPAPENKAAPEYVRRGTFLWGLRNDLQHGDYWCLSVQRHLDTEIASVVAEGSRGSVHRRTCPNPHPLAWRYCSGIRL